MNYLAAFAPFRPEGGRIFKQQDAADGINPVSFFYKDSAHYGAVHFPQVNPLKILRFTCHLFLFVYSL